MFHNFVCDVLHDNKLERHITIFSVTRAEMLVYLHKIRKAEWAWQAQTTRNYYEPKNTFFAFHQKTVQVDPLYEQCLKYLAY